MDFHPLYYKIATNKDGRLWSLDSPRKVEYVPGRETIDEYPLFVFDTLDNAIRRTEEWHPSFDDLNWEIWAVVVTNPRSIAYGAWFWGYGWNEKTVADFWSYGPKGNQRMMASYNYTGSSNNLPRGTNICDSVRLIRQVRSNRRLTGRGYQ